MSAKQADTVVTKRFVGECGNQNKATPFPRTVLLLQENLV